MERLAQDGDGLRDALSGTWLGHALHPLPTDVVIGSFLSATLLDLLGGDDTGRASERLIEVGLVTAAPTVARRLDPVPPRQPRRTGPASEAVLEREGARASARRERLVPERTWLLIVSDFVPGGRTAAMFAAGALGLPTLRFYGFIVPGALLWAGRSLDRRRDGPP